MKKFFVFIFLFSFLFFFSFPVFAVETTHTLIESWDGLYEDMAEDVLEWEKEGVYYVSFEPKKIELEEIRG